jgi:hypothetical protein
MHRILGLVVLVLSLASPRAHAWEVLMTQAGVTVAQQNVAGSPIMAFRGEGVMDVPISVLVSLLLDDERATEWVDLQAEHWVISQESADFKHIYERYDLPFPIDDRDYVISQQATYDDANAIFTLNFESVNDPAKPVSDCCERAMAYRTFWRLTKVDDSSTKVEIEVHTDPKGMLPSWLINMIQKDWPWKTISGLVKRAKKGDISPEERTRAW